MTANNIQQLYSDYRTATEYPPDYTLDFIARNTILFNNIKSFKDADELNLYVQLSWQHLNALYGKDRFNETADNAIKYLHIIDSEIDRLNLHSSKDDWYYGLLLFKGMAIYRLRDYKTSTPIFKQLVAHDTKNENYKSWLSYSLYGQRMWISKTIVIICMVLMLIEFFFEEYIPSFIGRMSLLGIALTGLIGTSIYDYYIKRSRRKSQLK